MIWYNIAIWEGPSEVEYFLKILMAFKDKSPSILLQQVGLVFSFQIPRLNHCGSKSIRVGWLVGENMSYKGIFIFKRFNRCDIWFSAREHSCIWDEAINGWVVSHKCRSKHTNRERSVEEKEKGKRMMKEERGGRKGKMMNINILERESRFGISLLYDRWEDLQKEKNVYIYKKKNNKGKEIDCSLIKSFRV